MQVVPRKVYPRVYVHNPYTYYVRVHTEDTFPYVTRVDLYKNINAKNKN